MRAGVIAGRSRRFVQSFSQTAQKLKPLMQEKFAIVPFSFSPELFYRILR
jgi:hypothetical protein